MLGPLLASAAVLAACETSGGYTALTQADFAQGTFRITQPGKYRLEEDVEFSPQAGNGFWPPESLRSEYPHAQYYLGFFAAITIECSCVELDLGGHTLKQGKEFNLMQRLFNVIELNDRVFVANEGVSSLNYQRGDKVTETAAGVPPLAAASQVVIKNGVLGRSSHAGIHGNNVHGVTVKDVEIRDFEVAGFQCNACKDVVVQDCVVGPTAQDVPVVATFASARYLDLYVNTLIPDGFSGDPMNETLLAALDDEITFAGRANATTLRAVFDRVGQAVQLFRAHYMGTAAGLGADDEALLQEAIRVFHNPSGLTDGGAVYGLFFNEGAADGNHYAAGVDAAGITVKRTVVKGLKAKPLEVPNLVTQGGAHIQGPVRDVLRIFDVITGQMRSLSDTRYAGNFLSDAYFAMWKLSNAFYRARVFDSECGNFLSNATVPYNLFGYPSSFVPTCTAAGSQQDTSLTGRDVTMLQKRYFGGLTMTQGVYEWGTEDGRTLDTLLATPVEVDARRQQRHVIRCDQDTGFQASQGVIGIKVVQAKGVTVKHVTVKDIGNTADLSHWVCDQAWELATNGEAIKPVTSVLSKDGASVRGLQLVRSEEVVLSNVVVEDLTSDEGRVTGIEAAGDTNDRTEHDDDVGIQIKQSRVSSLTAGGGPFAEAKAFKAVGTALSTGGLTVGKPAELAANLGNRKTVLYCEQTYTEPVVPGQQPGQGVDTDPLGSILAVSSYDTEEKVKALRAKKLRYFTETYGMRWGAGVDDTPIQQPILIHDIDGNPTGNVVIFGSAPASRNYHVRSFCQTDAAGVQTCSDDLPYARLDDFFWVAYVLSPLGYVLHGTFGGDHGQWAPPGSYVAGGLYVVDGLEVPGVSEGKKLEIDFYSSPGRSEQLGQNFVHTTNLALESPLLGKGVARTPSINTVVDGEWQNFNRQTMVFDDSVQAPVASTAPSYPPTDAAYPRQAWTFRVTADGTFPVDTAPSDVFPLLHAFHFTHEAGVNFLKRKTSVNDDTKVRALRVAFLQLLADTYGIQGINCTASACYDDVPLDGVVDLGGGNHVVAYEVSEAANFRTTAKFGHDGNKTVPMPAGSRIHEGGFRLLAGNAGITTSFGHLPVGSLIQQGIYVVEDGANEWEFTFQSQLPMTSSVWSTSVALFRVDSPYWGPGRMAYVVPMADRSAAGLTHGIYGALESLSWEPFVPPTAQA